VTAVELLRREDGRPRSATRQTRGMSPSCLGSRCNSVSFGGAKKRRDVLEFLEHIAQRHRDTRNGVPTQHAYDGNSRYRISCATLTQHQTTHCIELATKRAERPSRSGHLGWTSGRSILAWRRTRWGTVWCEQVCPYEVCGSTTHHIVTPSLSLDHDCTFTSIRCSAGGDKKNAPVSNAPSIFNSTGTE
jgi:hypothetical protein